MRKLSLVLWVVASACSNSGGSTTTGDMSTIGATDMTTTTTGLNPVNFAGTWNGTWNNTTFSSTGPAKATVTADATAKTVTFVLDLDGNVFGASNPPAETFTGTYDDTQYTVSGTSATFGTLTLNVTRAGVITGSATPSRGATTLTGTTTESTMTINYKIADPPNADITGVLTLTK